MKQFGFALALAAGLAGGGLALAVEAPSDPEDEIPIEDVVDDTNDVDELDVDEVDDDAVEEDEEAEAEEEAADTEEEADAPQAPDVGSQGAQGAHGAAVSQAAHDCPHGPGGVHGECVSAVAHTNGGHAGTEARAERGNGRDR